MDSLATAHEHTGMLTFCVPCRKPFEVEREGVDGGGEGVVRDITF
jgi:hypothetical protein